jgi:hypothetical protein
LHGAAAQRRDRQAALIGVPPDPSAAQGQLQQGRAERPAQVRFAFTPIEAKRFILREERTFLEALESTLNRRATISQSS